MNDNNELLVIYGKDTGLSFQLSRIFEGRNMRNLLITRNILIDTVGSYNLIYTRDTDIQSITDLLTRECLGYSIYGRKENSVETELSKPIETYEHPSFEDISTEGIR